MKADEGKGAEASVGRSPQVQASKEGIGTAIMPLPATGRSPEQERVGKEEIAKVVVQVLQNRKEARLAERTGEEDKGVKEGQWGATSSWEEAKQGDGGYHIPAWKKAEGDAKPQKGVWEDRTPKEDLVEENDKLKKALKRMRSIIEKKETGLQ